MIALVFYSFATLLVLGALSVVFLSNPIKSVLSLVFCFLNAAALLIMIGAEFFGTLLIIVYVGAIVVFFLFVVMTISTQHQTYTRSFTFKYIPFLIGIISAIILAMSSFNEDFFTKSNAIAQSTQVIAQNLYTNQFLQFQLSGIVLLIALIGAIVLSNRKTDVHVKKQNVWKQIMTNPINRIKLVNKIE